MPVFDDLASVVVSTVLPGRTAQWAALGEQLDLLRRGTGGVALLDGPPGCGRTALLDAVTARAAAAGTTVLRATASAAERPVPFGVAAQLCGRPLPDPGPDPAARALRVGELGAALPPGPVLVAVDDAGETDDASLGLLRWIARRTGPGRPVLLLVAAPGAALAHDLRRCPAARDHVVGPLDADAVAEVCRARVGPGPEAVLAATGGHPGLVAALLTDHAAGRTTVPGPALVRAVEVLLARLPEGASRLALALAVTGRRPAGPPSATGAVPGPAGPRRAAATCALAAAGLLTGDELPGGVRDAVLAGVPPTELRALRLRAAERLHDRGAPAAEVADRLAEAGGALPSWAVGVLVRAADEALCDGRTATARTLARVAVTAAAGAGPADVLAADACSTRAEWRAGPGLADRLLTRPAAAVAQLPGPELAPLLRRLLWHGRTDEAGAVAARLRAVGGPDAGAVEGWLVRTHPGSAGPGPTPLSPRPEPVPGDPAVPAWTAVADALAAVCTRDRRAEAAATAEQALVRVRPRDPACWWPEVAFELLLVLVYAGRPAVACERAAAIAAEEPPGPGRALVRAAGAEAALRLGRLGAAGAAASAALEIGPGDWGVACGVPLATAVVAATRAGRLGDAAALLARPVPPALFGTRYGLHYLFARGEYHLAADHTHAALADFLSCGELAVGWGLDRPTLVPWRTGAAAARLGGTSPRDEGRSEARRLLQEQLAATGAGPSGERGAALRLLAAAGRSAGREQVLEEAVAVLEAAGDRYGTARALADLARVHAGARRHRRALATARQALTLAVDCGADALATTLRAHCTADPDPERGRTAAVLTAGERRVAELAAAGLTNREIAQRLHITASTAEQHLTRVFRKLGVRDRTSLPASLGSGPAAETAAASA